MTNLYTIVTYQTAPDASRSTDAGVLTYVATNLYTQPSYQAVFDIGGSNNSAASPFPIFTGEADARAYFDSIAESNLLPLANAQTTLVTYTALDIESVDPSTLASFSSLAAVARTGNYSDLTGTPSIPAAQVNSDWNAVSGVTQIQNKPSLAAVALSGAYSDLSGKPSIPSAQVNSDWNANSGLAQILNRPVLASVAISGQYSDLTGRPTLAAVATSGDYNDLSNKPSLAAVATSGDYNDLSNKPSLAAVATSGAYSDLTGKPSIPVVQAYEGATQRLGAFPIFAHATVSSGVAVFNLTNDGTSGGTPLFPNGVIQDSLNLFVNDATAAYQMSAAWSNSNKTVTVTANKLGTASLLTGILGQIQANSAVIKLSVWVY